MPSYASSACALSTMTGRRDVVRRSSGKLVLRVERALAERDDVRARARDPIARARRLRRRVGAPGTTRLTSPQSHAVSASIISPVSNISSARLRPIVRATGTIGVEQNKPMLTPGRREAGVVGCDREIARGDELAPGRGRDAVDLGDDRLGQLVHAGHQAHAGREELFVERPRRGSRSSPRGRGRPRTRDRVPR